MSRCKVLLKNCPFTLGLKVKEIHSLIIQALNRLLIAKGFTSRGYVIFSCVKNISFGL